MKIIYPETSTIKFDWAFYENGLICYSWYGDSVRCFNEIGFETHSFKVKTWH